MKKVIVSDYDGTFFINDEDIRKNIERVKEFRKLGNIFIFATGRSYTDFKEVKDKYNLEYDYLILNHGATILDSNNNLLNINILNKENIYSLVDYLNLDKSIRCFCCSTNSDRTDFSSDNLIKINVKYNDTNLVKHINEIINKNFGLYYNSFMASEHTLEIVSFNSSKLIALDFLIDMFNFDCNNVYTIGNGDSDIEMLKKYNGFIIGDYSNEFKKYSSVHKLIEDIMGEKV